MDSDEIGFTEPQPLGINNIVFLYSLLGATIIMSVVIAALEKGINKMNLLMSKSKDGGALFTRRGNEKVEARKESRERSEGKGKL